MEEEVRGKLREQIATRQAETDRLVQLGEKLSEGNSRLSLVMSRLQQELAETESSVDLLRQKTEEMQLVRERLGESLGQLDCDEAVTATAPLFTQLIEGYAEDAAIEDALYFLGESLRRGIIDSEVFLKHVRNLSRYRTRDQRYLKYLQLHTYRKQFLLRATMLKCRKIGGLKV